MSDNERQVRVHITVPGPRAGVPYSLSIETVNAGDLLDDELTDEVNAAVVVYREAKRQMDEELGIALEASVKAAQEAKHD